MIKLPRARWIATFAFALGFTALNASPASATPIASLANLTNVTFYEATFTVLTAAFSPADPRILNRTPNPLNDGNADFTFFGGEDYDVFFSDSLGNPTPAGSFVTIEGILVPGVFAGGMNITGVQLNFSSGPSQLADFVSRFVMVGCGTWGGCIPGSEQLAVDGDLSFGTIPRFGATLTYPTDPTRMSLTVGWRGISQDSQQPSAVPEPASLTLVGLGITRLAFRLRRRTSK